MQAPSRQLLRALRNAVNTPRTSIASSGPQCTHLPSLTLRDSNRCLSTSSRLSDVPKKVAVPSAPADRQTRQGNIYAPKSKDRGPKSSEDTQTDFGVMDVLGNIPAPATSIDACTPDGFHLDNGVKTEGGSGILLVGGEAFTWEPWQAMPTGDGSASKISDMLDARRGILSIPKEGLKILELIHPKPDLLIVGTGSRLWMLSKEVREYITEVLGCRLDVMDTANASSAYNLLAKERGVEGGAGVGGLMLPLGWRGPQEAPRRTTRVMPKR